MVGGFYWDNVDNYLSRVELFPLPSSDACFIPDLPKPRKSHSLSLLSGGRLVVCGGWNGGTLDSCISWVAGNPSWTHYHSMRCPPIMPHKIIFIKTQCAKIWSHSLDAALSSRLHCASGRIWQGSSANCRDCARCQSNFRQTSFPSPQVAQHFHWSTMDMVHVEFLMGTQL